MIKSLAASYWNNLLPTFHYSMFEFCDKNHILKDTATLDSGVKRYHLDNGKESWYFDESWVVYPLKEKLDKILEE